MTLRHVFPLLALAILAACGDGSGALDGKWGADCASPFVSFSGNTIHVYPDDADYTLKSTRTDGANITVSYDAKTGPVTETYVYENNTLRLDKGTYGGMEAVWHKQPMNRCP